MPNTISAIIPYHKTHRNSDGHTVIPFDTDIVGTDPIVILQPFLHVGIGESVGFVPIVKEFKVLNGQSTVIIDDRNEANNYYLNVLLVKRYTSDIHGLPTFTSQTPKGHSGGKVVPGIQLNSAMPEQVNILTGYGSAIPNAQYAMESVQHISRGSTYTNVLTNSGNGGSGYWINNVSSIIKSIPHAAESGIAKKTTPFTRVNFTDTWDHPPIVFVTPIASDNPRELRNIETVTHVTPTYFLTHSENKGNDLSVQWLALTSNPNFHKHHVDKGIEHFLEHFPEFTDRVHNDRSALEAEIIHGTPAPSHTQRLRTVTNVNDPYVTTFNGGKIALDVAKLIFDGTGLILTCIGAKSAYDAAKNAKVAEAIAAKLEEVPSETTALIKNVESLIEEMKKAENLAARAHIQGRIILAMLSGAFGLGVIKIVLTRIYQTMTEWQFIVLCVKLATQFAAIVAGAIASAGAIAAMEFIAWIGRIASILMGTANVGIDLFNLINDISGKGPSKHRPLPIP